MRYERIAASAERLTDTTFEFTAAHDVSRYFVVCDVTAFTGGTNVTFYLEAYDLASASWAYVADTGALTATGKGFLSNGSGPPIGRRLRVRADVTGTFSALTYSVGGWFAG